jgi:hypothetical protein
VHCFIVDVGAHALCDVESVILRFGSLSEMLLFIADVVLGASHHASVLDALDCRSNQSAGQVWIRRETFLLQS